MGRAARKAIVNRITAQRSILVPPGCLPDFPDDVRKIRSRSGASRSCAPPTHRTSRRQPRAERRPCTRSSIDCIAAFPAHKRSRLEGRLPFDPYQVKILNDGFEYAGARYRSLSAIAQAITGTKWNGYLFFGLGKEHELGDKQKTGAS